MEHRYFMLQLWYLSASAILQFSEKSGPLPTLPWTKFHDDLGEIDAN